MVLKLYGSSVSTATERVAVVLKEKNIPFQLITLNVLKGECRTPEYTAHQPFGQIPYIVTDEGFELYESRAIMRYLEENYPAPAGAGPLIPTDLKGRAKFEQAASVEMTNFDPFAFRLNFELVVKEKLGLTPDPAAVKTLTETLRAKLAVYDKILSKQKYLAGTTLTLADLAHLPFAHRFTEAHKLDFFVNDTERPHVARWYRDIAAREAWMAVRDGVPASG